MWQVQVVYHAHKDISVNNHSLLKVNKILQICKFCEHALLLYKNWTLLLSGPDFLFTYTLYHMYKAFEAAYKESIPKGISEDGDVL